MAADFSLSGTNLFQHATTTAPAQSACPSGTSGLAQPQDDFEAFGPAQPGHPAATCAPCAGGFSHAQQQFADSSQNLEPGALPSRLGSPYIAGTTWGINCEAPFTSDDVYGVVLTRCGGKVTATTHDLGLVVDSSSFAEAIGTSKTGEIVEHGRAIETGLGVPPRQPTYVFTDNRANALVGSGAGTLRSRHAIRRYVSFLQRVETGTCKLRFLPDSKNPADCLTKAVPHAKFLSSLTWMQGEAPR